MLEIQWMKRIGEIHRSDNEDELFWMVPEPFCRYPLEYCITSPYFSFCGTRWYLIMMPSDGKRYAKGGHMALFLRMIYCKSWTLQYSVRMGLKKPNEDLIFDSGETSNFGFGKWSIQWNRIYSIAYVSSGCMKFFCNITEKNMIRSDDSATSDDDSEDLDLNLIDDDDDDSEEESGDENSVTEVKKVLQVNKGIGRLLQNFKQLLTDGLNSDTVLKVEEKEFRVHKTILAVRSPVFASMFQHDTAENASGVVDIPDCSAASFEVFLLYLYSGSADTMSSDNVLNLYYIADKYQVDDLKEECVVFMKDNLSVDTFCGVIALSLTHSESELQKAATRFFCHNLKKVIKTVQWQKYLVEYPTHANELFIKAVNA